MKLKEGQLITDIKTNQICEITEAGKTTYFSEMGKPYDHFSMMRCQFQFHFRETTDEDIVQVLDKQMRKNLIDNEINELREELESAE